MCFELRVEWYVIMYLYSTAHSVYSVYAVILHSPKLAASSRFEFSAHNYNASFEFVLSSCDRSFLIFRISFLICFGSVLVISYIVLLSISELDKLSYFKHSILINQNEISMFIVKSSFQAGNA